MRLQDSHVCGCAVRGSTTVGPLSSDLGKRRPGRRTIAVALWLAALAWKPLELAGTWRLLDATTPQ